MCFLRYILLLAVTLFAAIASAAPPVLPDVPVRAAHRVAVTVPDLHWAALEGDVAEVKRLIAAGADLNATETVYSGDRALDWAVRGGPGVVRALHAAGANLEARNEAGETALFAAVRVNDSDNYSALLALLVAGANATARQSTDSLTALHLACLTDYPGGMHAAAHLRRFGADPNATMTWDLALPEHPLAGDSRVTGVTPLHVAATRPANRFWGAALNATSLDPHERELQLNARDSNGRTPLHWLVIIADGARDVGVLTWLVLSGADVNAVDRFGATALDWADALGQVELAATLRAGGGENRYTGGTGGGTAPPPGGGGGVAPPAPPPAPPPFQPQPVEVALGDNGGTVTLMTTEGGGFTLNSEAFAGGPANPVEGEGGRMYVLTLTDGSWSAAFRPMEVMVALGNSGESVTLMTTEAGGFTLNGEAFTGGAANPVSGADGRRYVLTFAEDGTWRAALEP